MRDIVLYSLKWVALGKIVSQSVRWLTTIFTIRLLIPEDYALIALAAFFTDLLWSISVGSITAAAIREEELTQQKLSQFFTFSIIVHLVFFIALQVSAPLIASFYDNPNLATVIHITAFNFIISLAGLSQKILLNKQMHFKQLALVNASTESVGAITTLTMAWLGFSYWSIVTGIILTACLQQIGYIAALRRWIWPQRMSQEIARMKSFVKRTSIFGTLAHVSNNIDIAIAGMVMSVHSLGIYQFAVMIAMMPASKVMPLIRQVALPAYAQIQKDRSKFNYYFLKSQRLAFLLFAPIFWGIAATSQQLVPAVFGDKWEAASAVLTAYCIMMPFRTSHELFNPALKTLDKVRILISNEILILTVMCPLFYLLGEKGPLGLAFAWLTGYAFCFCIIAYRCCKALDVKLKEYGLSIYIPILAGMGMFICVYFTGQRMEALSISALATVGTQIVVGVITYVGLLTLLGKHLIKELLSLRK